MLISVVMSASARIVVSMSLLLFRLLAEMIGEVSAMPPVIALARNVRRERQAVTARMGTPVWGRWPAGALPPWRIRPVPPRRLRRAVRIGENFIFFGNSFGRAETSWE